MAKQKEVEKAREPDAKAAAAAPKAKIGEGSLSAFGRQGLRELRGALYPESNVAQQTEYGMYGTQTPGEVADARDPDRNGKHGVHGMSALEGRMEAVEARSMEEPQREEQEMDR